MVDPSTGELQSVLLDLDPIDAQVVEALSRVRASGASVQTTGARFVDIEKLTDAAELDVLSQTRDALSRLVSRSLIAVESISVLFGDDWFEVSVVYFNLRRRASIEPTTRTVRIPFGALYGAS